MAQWLERIRVVDSRQSPLIVRLRRTDEELAIYRQVLSSKERLLTISDAGHLLSDGYKLLAKSTIISSVRITVMSCFFIFDSLRHGNNYLSRYVYTCGIRNRYRIRLARTIVVKSYSNRF